MKTLSIFLLLSLSPLTAVSQVTDESDALIHFGVEKVKTYEVSTSGLVLSSDTVIKAERIIINGPILTLGNRLSLIAHNIHFTSSGAIYSYQNIDMPGSLKPFVPHPPKMGVEAAEKNPPARGQARSANSRNDAKDGAIGYDGKKGANGYQGALGNTAAKPINLVSTSITGNVRIFGNGQTGGEGGNGVEGQNGGLGGIGGQGWSTCGDVSISDGIKLPDSRRSGNGGAGGRAGHGGDGGNGGLGGLNPEINIMTTHEIVGDIVSLPGLNGAGGKPGTAGTPADGGPPGGNKHSKIVIDLIIGSKTICSRNSGVGQKGAVKLERMGTPAVKGSIPRLPYGDHGCFNLRGNEGVHQAILSDLGMSAKELRKKLKENFILKKFYALSVITIGNLSAFSNTAVIDGKIPLDDRIYLSVIRDLKKDWTNEFLKPVANIKKSTVPLEFTAKILRYAKRIEGALTQLENKEFDLAQDGLSQLLLNLKNEFVLSLNGLAVGCREFKQFRGDQLQASLGSMGYGQPTQDLSPRAQEVLSCVKQYGMDNKLTFHKEIQDLEQVLKTAQSKYIKPSEAELGFAVPFCDDSKFDVDTDDADEIIAFMDQELKLFLSIPCSLNGTDCSSEKIAQLAFRMKGRKSLVKTDPLDFIKFIINGPDDNRRILRELIKTDAAEYEGYKFSSIRTPKLSEMNAKNLGLYLRFTSILMGGN